MSVPTDASVVVERPRAGVLDRVRASTLVVDIAIVSGVSLVLGLIRLGAPALWFDEAYTFRQLQKGYLEQFEGYQPFYYWIVKPWTSVAGTSEWAMRLPSVVGAMLAGALLVVLGRKLFDRRVALLAGLLLATSPYFVKWSQQARAYPLLVAASLVATMLLLRAVERGTRAAWLVYGLAFAGLLVTHAAVALLLVPAHAVLVAQRRERAVPHGLLAAILVCVIGGTWVAQLAMRTESEVSETAWIPYPSAEYVSGAVLGVSGAAGIGLVLSALGLWTLRRTGERARAVWLAAWAFGPFAFALLISLARPMFLDRYLAIAAPAFALLAAVGVFGLTFRLRVVALAAAAAASAAALVLWYQTAEDGNWRGEDWRSAVAAVRERSKPGDAVVVVPWWAHDAAEYYGAPAEDVSLADSIWVLHWSESGPALPAEVRRPLGFGDHVLAETLRFGWRVSAHHWVRPAS
jgi:mannosyltransferase